MNIKLDSDTISSMNVFSDVTSVFPRDCIVREGRMIFIVNQGQAGVSIGKNGNKIKMLQKMFDKEITVIEYSDDPVRFLGNILKPVELVSGYLANGVENDKKLEASAKGKISGAKIKLAKFLMQRYFNIMNINIR